MPRRRRSLRGLAGQTAKKTDELLKDQEAALLARTDIDWAALRPKVTDKETFDRLMTAVQASTQRNDSIANLKSRVHSLGTQGLAMAKRVASLVSPIA